MARVSKRGTHIEIGPFWSDPEVEYEAIKGVLLPVAIDSFRGTAGDWDAIDTKAMGLLALDVAVLAVLVAVHQSLNRYWWIAAVICAGAGVLLGSVLWLRTDQEVGPDVLRLHGEMAGSSDSLLTARGVLQTVVECDEKNRDTVDEKIRLFWGGLGVLVAALVASGLVSVLRPSGQAQSKHVGHQTSVVSDWRSRTDGLGSGLSHHGEGISRKPSLTNLLRLTDALGIRLSELARSAEINRRRHA